ncbi:MAG: glycoside hydrolase family 130 protein [Streptococcaceae bacterium]|jgi:predicted GH43/DUF377 family glycosyl hydrolase|nr:glycoside hydrolase family 130 protein [Streptococcaceae bacterium]
MKINRFVENPLITPDDVKPYHQGFEVIGAFNAGVAFYKGETLLLLRVAERPISETPNIIKVPLLKNGELTLLEIERDDPRYDFSDPRIIHEVGSEADFIYLTSLSYIRIARSRDGHRFTIDESPFLYPFNEFQNFGIEDARCTQIGDENYYINFTSVSEMGIIESLVKTTDFESFEDMGNIFLPDNKDILIFPEKINNRYYALSRPVSSSLDRKDIWISKSSDLKAWGEHRHLLNTSKDDWDNGRVGGGLVPIRTEKGWLEIYHGATKNNVYCMGALLLDLDDPTKVLAKSKAPLMMPEMPYEKEGFFGEVVFACGGIVNGDKLTLYYGVADRSMAACELSISEILSQLESELE